MPFDWSPLWLTLRCAGVATLCSIPPALLLAWVLARRHFRGSELLDAAANLPLLLPAAVLAYYLLSALKRWPVVFEWNIAVLLSAIYTFPLMMRLSRSAFEGVDHIYGNAARSLGSPEWRVFWRVTLPIAWRPLAAAALASFARSLADFGLTAIVASGTTEVRWIFLSVLGIAVTAFFALYAGSRLRRERKWA